VMTTLRMSLAHASTVMVKPISRSKFGRRSAAAGGMTVASRGSRARARRPADPRQKEQQKEEGSPRDQ